MPNGLLPAPRAGGRPAGRGALGPPPGRLLGVGRGAPGAGGRAGLGLGLGVGGSTDGPAWAASRLAAWAARCDASCSALSADARASAAATSMSCALAGFIAAGGAGTGLRRPAAFAGGAGLAATFGALLAAAGAAAGADEATIASRSRRATAASTVLDTDLTYSPISWSFARTVLLSTPSSFASSCTRALPATALLTCEVVRATRNDLSCPLEAWSFLELHRVLMLVVLPCASRARRRSPHHRSYVRAGMPLTRQSP